MLRRVPAPEWNGTTLQWSNATEVVEWQAQTSPDYAGYFANSWKEWHIAGL